MNSKELIQKSIKIHYHKYDYSLVKYINAKTKIKIVCPKHGVFEQYPYSHLNGHGCNLCHHEERKISLNDFIKRSNKIHQHKYDYSHSVINNHKVKIICPIHGEFEQLVRNHLSGKGCKKCSHDLMKLTLHEFTEKSNRIHNFKYKYDKVFDPIIKNKRIKIICPIHGEFEQTPSSHLKGHGCKKCSRDLMNYNNSKFIEMANQKHRHKYDYSKVNYINSYNKVIIICPVHGEFKQIPSEHLRGHGCIKCAIERTKLNKNEFINKSNIRHQNKYDYCRVNFKSYYDNVTIICPVHGEFEQTVSNHLSGHGCPTCPTKISRGHQEIIDFIKSIYIKEISINDRNILKPYELDIFLPDERIGIEYHGNYWHSHDHKESSEKIIYHQRKHKLCVNNCINLLQIYEYEWLNKQEIIKSKIKNLLGLSNKIYARNCKIIEDKGKVLLEGHLQGYRGATLSYGLCYNNELVSVMSFNKYNNNRWEIIRFTNKLNHSVIGGASKLFGWFLKNNNFNEIITYADARYSVGNLYRKLGFKFEKITKPNYCYIKGNNIFSRQQFQKHKLKNKLEFFNPDLSEAENMFNNGYRRLWDAGHYKFVYQK